jgi:hypothetical protein
MVISPRYDQYMDAWDTSVLAEVYLIFFFLHFNISLFIYVFFLSNSRNYDSV